MASTIPDPEITRLSGDSHVLEPRNLWVDRLPAKFKDQALQNKGRFERLGGRDPKAALLDMAADGITAQTLFPSNAGGIYQQFYEKRPFDLELAKAEERVYNDWMIEYCSEDFDRLWGLGLIGLWDIDYAIAEMVRTKEAGLKGVATWAAPPDEIPYSGEHYERFWSAAEELQVPVCLHINIGFGSYVTRGGEDRRRTVARQAYGHKHVAQTTVADLILFGALERHPELKIMLAEFDCGWIPFFLEDLDRKFHGWRAEGARRAESRLGLEMLPSEYFSRNIYATFMQDGVAGHLLSRWGADNFIYSNDYPHGGGAWPYTDDSMLLLLKDLPRETRRKVMGENLAKVFGQPLPPPVKRLPLTNYSEELPPDSAPPRPEDYVPTDTDWHWVRPWLKRADEFTFDKPKMGLAQ